MLKPPNIFIQDAHLSFHGKELFKNLSLTLAAGKWTCLLGPSGVGKTTLLRLIANLIPPDTQFKGKIFCDDEFNLSENVAYMAQTDLLMPWLTVLDNVLIVQELQSQINHAFKEKAKELLFRVGLKEFLSHYPHQLSGGMRQRVALVRTLIQNKPIVLMDEPFSAVDAITRFQLQTLAANLLNQHTVLLITHDPMEALRLAHDIYVLGNQPITLQHFHFKSAIPRDPSDDELRAHQSTLFQALTIAKENCL